jgi:hypothetical protein
MVVAVPENSVKGRIDRSHARSLASLSVFASVSDSWLVSVSVWLSVCGFTSQLGLEASNLNNTPPLSVCLSPSPILPLYARVYLAAAKLRLEASNLKRQCRQAHRRALLREREREETEERERGERGEREERERRERK